MTEGFVGRTGERDRLRTAVTGVVGGWGGGIWIDGGAGLGKSRLLTECLGADATGWARAGETSPAEPFGAVLACLDDAAPARPDLAVAGSLLRSLRANPPRLGPVLRQFRRAARNQPIILVLDDLHRADDASLQVWAQLHRVARTDPLLLVSAARPVAHPGLDAAHTTAAAGGTPTISLVPLTEGEATTLAYACGHHPHVVDAAVRDAGGNPAYLRMLADGRGEPPPALRALVTEHLSTLTERTRRTLTLLAQSPPGASAVDLAARGRRVLGDLRSDLNEALHAAVLISTGGTAGFRHPIVRRVLRMPRRRGTSSSVPRH